MELFQSASAALILAAAACSSPSGGPLAEPDAAVMMPQPDAPATTTTASCDTKTAQPLDATWNIAVGSAMRVARVHVPASYQPQKRTPLVINIHGRSGWGY